MQADDLAAAFAHKPTQNEAGIYTTGADAIGQSVAKLVPGIEPQARQDSPSGLRSDLHLPAV